MKSLVGNGSIVVINGHILTSPSVYFETVGTAAVNDECGGVGPNLTNPLITFPPGKLFTWKPPDPAETSALHINFGIGQIWIDSDSSGAAPLWGKAIIGTVEPLNVDDLACPTWGFGKTTFVNGTVLTTIGSPYLRLMIPDMHAFTLDPTWAQFCSGVFTGLGRLSSFAILDPPHPLTPASLLVPLPTRTSTPASTSADPTPFFGTQHTSSVNPARPASPTASHQRAPTNTYDPPEIGKTTSPDTPSSDPARPALSSKCQECIATTRALAKTQPKRLPSGPLTNNVMQPNGEPAFLTPLPTGVLDTSASDSKLHTVMATDEKKFHPQNQRLQTGGQVLSVFPSNFELSSPTYPLNEPAMTMSDRVFTLISQPHSKNDIIDKSRSSPPLDVLKFTGYTTAPIPSEIVIYGFSIVPGDKSFTVSGTATTSSASGSLIVASFSTTVAPQYLAIISTQTFSVYQNGLELTGAVNNSGSAQTIINTVVSLGQSRALSTANTNFSFALPPSTQPQTEVPTVANPTFTPNPSGSPMAATTITAGGSAIPMYGTVVSLQPPGNPVVGTSTISLSVGAASATSTSSALVIESLNEQVQSSLVVVDGHTLTPGAHGTAVPGGVVNLESGSKTLDISGGHSVMTTSSVHSTVSVQTLYSGQGHIAAVSLCLSFWFWAGLFLLM